MPSRNLSASGKGVALRVKRLTATMTVCILSALCVVSGATLANADALDDQLANNRYATSSSDASIAAHQDALAAAEAELNAAENAQAAAAVSLGSAQAALADALAQDALRAEELAAAEAALEVAKAAVAKGEEDLAAQLKKIGINVLETRQRDNSMMGIAMLFTDVNVGDLNNRLQWAVTIYNVSQVEMDRLEEIQTNLLADQESMAAAEATATELKAASEQAVLTSQQLAAQAVAAEEAWATAVAQSDQLRHSAQQTLSSEEARNAQLRAEGDSIYAQIVARDTPPPPVTVAPPVTSGGVLLRPVGGVVTSPFGWRWHPILNYSEFHEGVDFGSPCGTPIMAAESGWVSSAGWVSGYGWYVGINHGTLNGTSFATAYGHMSSYAVSSGQWVSRGQVIGYVGTTGLSTGCHLHWNVWANGTYSNGLNYT